MYEKRKSIGLWVGICLLFLGIFGSVNVFAAVTEGEAGETLTGEYAVIINTDTSDSRSAGTLIFDDSGSTASVSSGSELPAAQSLAGLNTGSTSSVTALNEKAPFRPLHRQMRLTMVYPFRQRLPLMQ